MNFGDCGQLRLRIKKFYQWIDLLHHSFLQHHQGLQLLAWQMRLNCKPSQLHVHLENHMICSFNVNMLITGCIIFLGISKYLYTMLYYLLYNTWHILMPVLINLIKFLGSPKKYRNLYILLPTTYYIEM